MSHTIREKQKLINRVRRIRGQMEGVERMLEEEKGCVEVMQTIAGARGAINGLMGRSHRRSYPHALGRRKSESERA